MSKMTKIWKFLKGLFVKKVDKEKLFSDISNFVNSCSPIDYRKEKRNGKDLFTFESDGDTVNFGGMFNYEKGSVEPITIASPQSVVSVDRKINFVCEPGSVQKSIYKPKRVNPVKMNMISCDDMSIEEEQDAQRND